MKMTKKKVFVVALAVCLAAIISMGTLAWFNAVEDITNNFLIADSDGDGSPDFSVDLYENLVDSNGKFADTNNDGVINDQDGVTRDGNTYKNIAPGDKLDKNPTVKNTGDYDQWIRVYVTFDEWSKINAACANQGVSNDLRTWLNVNYGLDTPAWTAVGDGVVKNNAVTYVYYYNYKLVQEQTATLFTTVTIPGEFEQQDMQFVSGNFSIKVKAEALQADNTGSNAYDAFASVGWTEGIAYADRS